MKGVKFSCTWPASAAICTSIEPRSIVRPIDSGRVIHRNALYVRDPQRRTVSNPPPRPPSKAKSSTQNRSRKSFEQPINLVSPASSSRYLLTDTSFPDAVPASEPVPAPVSMEPSKVQPSEEEESSTIRPSSSSSPLPSVSSKPQEQVVMLRVSLHCKACEGKVRKHISKMQGVTSFSIDFAKKKVTVIGDVTPLGVLSSVSKVKNAQFWPLPQPSTSASAQSQMA